MESKKAYILLEVKNDYHLKLSLESEETQETDPRIGL